MDNNKKNPLCFEDELFLKNENDRNITIKRTDGLN